MNNRLLLHEKLVNILGSKNVYFQPPSNVSINYPCIVYKLTEIQSKFANNETYFMNDKYEITYITKNPDSDVPKKMLKSFMYIRMDRTFITQNINHYVFNLYQL